MSGSDMQPQEKQQLHQQLLDYCKTGCLDSIRSLLSGLPPDMARDIANTHESNLDQLSFITMHTPLTIASKSGHSQVVQLLVQDYKVDVNKASSSTSGGMTPLMLAANEGHLEVLNILIQARCNVNARKNSGETAVFLACREQQHAVVEHLVQNCADINLPNLQGATCLMIAFFRRDEQLVTILLESGADPNAEIKYKTYEVMESTRMSSIFLRQLLLRHLLWTPSSFDLEKRTTALHWAVKNGVHSAVRLLVRYGSRMFRDEEGHSPLDWAFVQNYRDIVEILAGSSVLSREEKIYSWVGLALLHESLSEALKYLHHASDKRKKDLLDFNPQTPSSPSPSNNCLHLHNAPFNTSMTLFLQHFWQMLEDDRTLPFSHVTEVLDYCVLRAEHEKTHGIPKDDSEALITVCLGAFFYGLDVAQDQEEERELQQLACRLVRLDPRCRNGDSLLHVLVNMLWQRWSFLPADLPFDRLLSLLLNSGASVHAKDDYGNRTLHEIALCPSDLEGSEMLASMTRTLVEAGAMVGVQNNAGLTPLKCAVTSTVSEILRPHFPPSLQSLAATEVMKSKIPFEDEIPQILHAFVELH